MRLAAPSSASFGDWRPSVMFCSADCIDDQKRPISGLFGIGAQPTGSSDPFGLRRAALGAVTVLRAFPDLRAITLPVALSLAAEGLEVSAEALETAREFAVRRYEQALLDAGHEHRFVQAVLPLADSPVLADETLAQLESLAGNESFDALAAALQRVRRIVPAAVEGSYDASVLSEPAEVALHKAFDGVSRDVVGLAAFFGAAEGLTGPINTFFDEVLVMAEDEKVKAARLGLLASIRDFAAPVLDWTQL